MKNGNKKKMSKIPLVDGVSTHDYQIRKLIYLYFLKILQNLNMEN